MNILIDYTSNTMLSIYFRSYWNKEHISLSHVWRQTPQQTTHTNLLASNVDTFGLIFVYD